MMSNFKRRVGFRPGRPTNDRKSFFRRVQSVNPALLVNKTTSQEAVVEYKSKYSFADFDIDPKIKANIARKNFINPTPIQDQAIPAILEGRDVVGIANTGTGKTAAFLIPLINKIVKDRSQKVLLIAPTRELAVQIEEEVRYLTAGLNIYSIICIGGVDMFRQVQGLRRNPNLVIGTPGRLKDLTDRRVLNLSDFRSIVLDEVDRMLDMGFVADVKYIVAQLATPRQSLFFSATTSTEVEKIMHMFLKNPVKISVKTHETASTIYQDVIKLNGRPKIDVLKEILISAEVSKVLIFGRTKWGIEKLDKELTGYGFKVASLHGNKRQSQRQRALMGFKSGQIDILLATDIASRGLDICDVSHVINFDLPASYEDYVHRIGRTGRAGKRGIALSLVD
jgi:superfamily II DNA/RNA helicase